MEVKVKVNVELAMLQARVEDKARIKSRRIVLVEQGGSVR